MSEAGTKFDCKIKVTPVSDWVARGATEKNCPPCLMSPLAGHYLGILEDAGFKDQKERLEKVWKGGEIQAVAKVLDEIKKEVTPAIRDQLSECDCFAQSFQDEG
jgi:hypothetical protein